MRGTIGREDGQGSTRASTRGSAMRLGFTIIEVIVIVVILGVLAAVIAPRVLQRIGQSKQSVAKAGVASMTTAVSQYIIDCGTPEGGASLSILVEKPGDATSWKGPYLTNADDVKDPWGNDYVLIIPSQHGNADFDIVCYGADGQPGGEGDDADIISGKKSK
jgi:general secretion pathway protein G